MHTYILVSLNGNITYHMSLMVIVDEPPLFGKGATADNYETGTRSAICGGTTTLITFAPQKKCEPSLLACLAATHARALNNCYSDYSFHLICSNAGPKAISEFTALREAGISSLKIYMTYEALQLKDSEILDVLFEARKQKIVGLKVNVSQIHTDNCR
jgi:dihydropyrimidinase